jgi:hypothetical protein
VLELAALNGLLETAVAMPYILSEWGFAEVGVWSALSGINFPGGLQAGKQRKR